MSSFDRALGDGRTIHLRTTDRSDGDLSVDGDRVLLDPRRRAITTAPWVWLRQVHGREVVVVGPDDDPTMIAGTDADAIVTVRDDLALAVHGADCATIGLWVDDGTIGAVHAGWRGLLDGVLEAAVAGLRSEMATADGGVVHAVVGPTIGPECYEFGPADLDAMIDRFGPSVRSRTSTGADALDVRAAFDVLAAELGLDVVDRDRTCTACAGDRLWSHRARGETGRQALVIWKDGR